jgi:hypothetical protein
MPHMVIHRGSDGEPRYDEVDEVADAARLVERLRNEQGVEHARIFRLEEVHFEFRPYFRVEVHGTPQPSPSETPGAAAVDTGRSPSPEPSPDEVDLGVDGNGGARRGLFGR